LAEKHDWNQKRRTFLVIIVDYRSQKINQFHFQVLLYDNSLRNVIIFVVLIDWIFV